MNVKDAFLLLAIKEKQAYLDRKSKEQHTNIVKPKYKINSNAIPSLGEYFFLVLTKSSSSCKPEFTLIVKKEDWENKINKTHLAEPFSYCDLRKHYELLNESELLYKIRDSGNGFRYIAKLSDSKFSELKCLKVRIDASSDVSEGTKELINRGIPDIVENILSNLGI